MDRTLNLQPGAGMNISNNNVQTPPSTQVNTPDQFNTAVTALLQKYQKMGTANFARQGLDAQELQANRISAPTSGGMIGASPTLQNSVRTNSAQAVDPTIQSANNSQQTFGEQLNTFGNNIKSAQDFMKTYQATQEQNKADAQNLIHDTISGGSDALTALLQSQPDLVKLAGYSADTLNGVIAGLKKTEQQTADSKKTFTPIDLGDKIGFYDQQGNLIRTEAKGSTNKGYTEVSPGATLFDPTTGKSIFTAPTTSAANGASTWSDPYMLGGSYVQKNTQTGEIRTAVNPPNAPAPTQQDKTQQEYNAINQLLTMKSSTGIPYTTTEQGQQYFTPEGYKAIINATSLSTNDFLDKYGSMFGLVYTKDGASVNPKYGLTPAQAKRIGY